MPQSQVSWRHHYIPEFYLKRWCGRDGKLVQFSRPHGDEVKPHRVAPRSTGFERNLYRLDGLPEALAAAAEQDFFRPVDEEASVILTKFERGERAFTGLDRAAWTQFLVSLVFRNPENVAATKTRLLDSLVETTAASERRWELHRLPDDPLTLREAMQLEIERDPAQVSRQTIHLIAAVTSSERIGSALYGMQWGIIRMPYFIPGLLTSDRPLHWFGGLGDTACHILMPITPKLVFWAVNTDAMARLIVCQPFETLARFLNEQTVRRARRFAYAMTDGPLPFVQQLIGQEDEISVADQVTRVPSAGEVRRFKKAFNPPWAGEKPEGSRRGGHYTSRSRRR